MRAFYLPFSCSPLPGPCAPASCSVVSSVPSTASPRRRRLALEFIREDVIREEGIREEVIREDVIREEVTREEVIREEVIREEVIRERVIREERTW